MRLGIGRKFFIGFVGVLSLVAVVAAISPSKAAAFAGGSGTQIDPYQIATCQDLQDITTDLDAHYILNNNIDCSATSSWNSGAGFVPIGNGFSVAASFSGTFNGNGKVISNLFINRSGTNLVGLFGITYGGNIYDFAMENVNITGAQYTGGVIGHVHYNSGTNQRGAVHRVYSTGSVTGTTRVGGIAGEQGVGDIANSYSRANITGTSGSWIGGFVGVTSDSTIANSHTGVPTKGISNSYATGNVSTASSNIRGGFSGGDGARITNAFATGSVTTGGSNGGGFHGRTSNSTVSGIYWLDHAGNPSACVGTFTAGTFACTSQADINYFKSASNAPMSSWDFTTVWAVNSGANDGFPYLQWQSFASPPSVDSDAATNVSFATAQLNGEVTSAGTQSLTRRGFVWGDNSLGAPGDVTPESSGYDSVAEANPADVGTFSKSLAGLASNTTYYYRAFATSSVGTTYGTQQSFTTQVNPDSDGDGILDEDENSTPNSGDANNDGTPDADQANVSSVLSSLTSKYITLELANDNCSISSLQIRSAGWDGNHDSLYAYTNGLVDFTASCTAPGMTTTVTVYYHNVASSNFTARKYNSNSGQYTTLRAATVTLTNVALSPVAALTYSVTDGGELDEDGVANSTIVDPVGLATPEAGGSLADTGQAITVPIIIATILASAACFAKFTKGRTSLKVQVKTR